MSQDYISDNIHTYTQKDTAFPLSDLCLTLDPNFRCLLKQTLITLSGLNYLLIYLKMGELKDIICRLQCEFSNQNQKKVIKIKKQFDKPYCPAENIAVLIAVILVSDF